jgi:HAD superfamily hydrolase (TIGR01490 family)
MADLSTPEEPCKRCSGFAFFDLDHTILPHDTQALFCNYILKKEPLRRLYLLCFAPFAILAACKLVDTRSLKRAFLTYLWRMPTARLESYCQDFARTVARASAYPEVLAEIARHKQEGRLLVLNSASPDFYARAIAEEFGFDLCYATPVELDGLSHVPFRPTITGENNKRAAKLRRMADILPTDIDPDNPVPIPDSYGYSDSSSDIPLLSLCPDENNTQIHPSARFRAYGAQRGWRVLTPPRPYRNSAGDMLSAGLQALGLYRT